MTVTVTRNVEEVKRVRSRPSVSLVNKSKHSSRHKLKKCSISSLSSSNTGLHEARSLTIRPRTLGVFTPQLPHEVWLQVLQYAVEADEEVVLPGSRHACHSFIEHVPPHAYLPERLARYNHRLKWQASLTTVCWMFNVIGQEVLYEEVWITGSKDGRRIAERLGGAVDFAMGLVTTCHGVRNKNKVTEQDDKWWSRIVKGKARSKLLESVVPPQSVSLGHRRSYSSIRNSENSNPGRFIRRLRIGTPAMDKCSPHDLLLILQHCPNLRVFEDYRSVRRPMHPLVITGSEVIPFGFNVDLGEDEEDDSTVTPILTSDALAHAVLSRPLQRLTWTNYAHDGDDFERGVRLYSEMIGPLLGRVGHGLEVLEVISSAEGVGMGEREARRSWVVGGPIGSENGRHTRSRRGGLSGLSGMDLQSLGLGVSRNLLTELELVSNSVTTRRFVPMDVGGLSSSETIATETPSKPPFVLPVLSSLKATLDNATFFVLSSWCMPALRNLSVISADYRYGSEGFRKFFEVHGTKIEQLELGHSSGEVEEFWVTERQQNHPIQQTPISLEAWCPNLKEFICSADAEWNWQSPDWIAPHVLLPSHLGLEFIGVRGLEKRLVGDADECMRRRRFGHHLEAEEDPYFMLLQQFGSLLREEAFPSLRYVRDLSWESDIMRRTGKMHISTGGLDSFSPSSSVPHSSSMFSSSTTRTLLSPKQLNSFRRGNGREDLSVFASGPGNSGMHVLRFWIAVLLKCRERGVWLEDCRGVNVTLRNLNKAAAGVI